MTKLRYPAAVAVTLALLLTACGSDDVALDDTPGGDAGPTDGDAGATDSEAHLRVDVAVRADRDADPVEATYACDADGDSLTGGDGADAACAALLDSQQWLREGPPADQVCTEIFAGPETAELDGEFADGTTFEREVDRADGCGADRWDRLAPALETD